MLNVNMFRQLGSSAEDYDIRYTLKKVLDILELHKAKTTTDGKRIIYCVPGEVIKDLKDIARG